MFLRKFSKLFSGYFIDFKHLNALTSTFKTVDHIKNMYHFLLENSDYYKFQKVHQIKKVMYLVAWKIIFIWVINT